ncbi:pilin [bacterium]|nr:pilin [bacterium]
MLSRFKRRDNGFTIIEIFVAVVIVLILAAISIPIYIHYIESARASDAQAAIGIIVNSVEMFLQENNGDYPDSVDELEEFEYFEIDEGIMRQWEFSLIGRDPIVQIEAISTVRMKGGIGKIVLYDVWTGEFSGYGSTSD